jgi:hypothetical protein
MGRQRDATLTLPDHPHVVRARYESPQDLFQRRWRPVKSVTGRERMAHPLQATSRINLASSRPSYIPPEPSGR